MKKSIGASRKESNLSSEYNVTTGLHINEMILKV